MKRIVIAAVLLALAAPAWATQYAVPDNGNTAADCMTGYVCIDSATTQTFSIGSLSFPPPYLANASSVDLASHGILAVVETAQPTGNFASVTSSIQMVSGVPTQVWATTPGPPPGPVYIPTATILGRLTTAEYTAIMQAAASQLAAGNGQLALWLDMARTSQKGIDPADATATAARAALIQAGLLTSARDAIVFAVP